MPNFNKTIKSSPKMQPKTQAPGAKPKPKNPLKMAGKVGKMSKMK